jgi:signal transduction histidine kinase
MRFKRSLRHRVMLSFALFGGAVSLLLAIGLYMAALDIEKRLIDETLTAELEDYVARLHRNPQSLPPATATIRGYVQGGDRGAAAIPEELLGLGMGRHQIRLDGESVRVAVADRDGKRFYFLYNEAQLLLRQRYLVAYLAAGVLIMVLMSAAGALWLAGNVISPVTELAARVRGLGPEAPSWALVGDFPADEVGELATACDRYLERLRRFIERERSFTADVSHELRTPLAVINGAAEVLAADDTLDARVRERIQRIERAAQDMSEITSALLVLAREGAQGTESVQECAVERVLRDVVDKHRHQVAGKPVAVEMAVNGRASIPAERVLLTIVLGNLVRNAFAYTDSGRILVMLDPHGVTVEDTGAGMRREDLDNAFRRYYRGASSQGEGIGLSLVKRICDRHGWQVTIASEEGRGTAVRLDFHPASPATRNNA